MFIKRLGFFFSFWASIQEREPGRYLWVWNHSNLYSKFQASYDYKMRLSQNKFWIVFCPLTMAPSAILRRFSEPQKHPLIQGNLWGDPSNTSSPPTSHQLGPTGIRNIQPSPETTRWLKDSIRTKSTRAKEIWHQQSPVIDQNNHQIFHFHMFSGTCFFWFTSVSVLH